MEMETQDAVSAKQAHILLKEALHRVQDVYGVHFSPILLKQVVSSVQKDGLPQQVD